MSTKLYNGYRLAAGTDPFAFCDKLRAALNPIRDQLDAALLADMAVSLIDRAHFGMESEKPDVKPTKLGPAAEAWLTYADEQRKLDPMDRWEDPHRFELSIGWDPDTGRHMLLLFCEESALREAFEAMPEVEEFGYWNNTDRPDNLTEQQWEARRDAWDRMLPGYTPPVEAMLTFKLRGDAGPSIAAGILDPDRAMLLANLPTPARRATVLLRSAICRRTLAAQAEKTDWIRLVVEANRLAAANHEALLPLLPEITAATLDEPYISDPDASATAQAVLDQLADRLAAE